MGAGTTTEFYIGVATWKSLSSRLKTCRRRGVTLRGLVEALSYVLEHARAEGWDEWMGCLRIRKIVCSTHIGK